MPQHFTVGDLIAALSQVPGHLPIRLAIRPDFPLAHHLSTDIVVCNGIAYLPEDGHGDHLPPAVCETLSWA